MGTVMVKGTPYVIVDICLRMLKPSEPSRPMASRPTTSSVTAPTASRSPRLSRCTCAAVALARRRWQRWHGPMTRVARSNAKRARLDIQLEPGGIPSLLKSFKRSRSSSVECAGVSCSGSLFFSSVIATSSGGSCFGTWWDRQFNQSTPPPDMARQGMPYD